MIAGGEIKFDVLCRAHPEIQADAEKQAHCEQGGEEILAELDRLCGSVYTGQQQLTRCKSEIKQDLWTVLPSRVGTPFRDAWNAGSLKIKTSKVDAANPLEAFDKLVEKAKKFSKDPYKYLMLNIADPEAKAKLEEAVKLVHDTSDNIRKLGKAQILREALAKAINDYPIGFAGVEAYLNGADFKEKVLKQLTDEAPAAAPAPAAPAAAVTPAAATTPPAGTSATSSGASGLFRPVVAWPPVLRLQTGLQAKSAGGFKNAEILKPVVIDGYEYDAPKQYRDMFPGFVSGSVSAPFSLGPNGRLEIGAAGTYNVSISGRPGEQAVKPADLVELFLFGRYSHAVSDNWDLHGQLGVLGVALTNPWDDNAKFQQGGGFGNDKFLLFPAFQVLFGGGYRVTENFRLNVDLSTTLGFNLVETRREAGRPWTELRTYFIGPDVDVPFPLTLSVGGEVNF